MSSIPGRDVFIAHAVTADAPSVAAALNITAVVTAAAAAAAAAASAAASVAAAASSGRGP